MAIRRMTKFMQIDYLLKELWALRDDMKEMEKRIHEIELLLKERDIKKKYDLLIDHQSQVIIDPKKETRWTYKELMFLLKEIYPEVFKPGEYILRPGWAIIRNGESWKEVLMEEA